MSSLYNTISNKLLNRYYNTIIRRKIRDFAFESQYWSNETWHQWQWIRVKQLVEYAYRWVPYYRKMFTEIGIIPDDIRTWNDYSQIPLLTRDIVKDNFNQLLTTHPYYRKTALLYSSSGSTGKPLSFYTSREQRTATSAFMDYQWSRIGYKPHDKTVIVRGVISPKLIEKVTYNVWNITASDLTYKNVIEIRDFFNTTRPDFIHAYPSSLWTLTNLFLSHNISLSYQPKGMLLGSEKYPQKFRDLFENFYNCKSYSWLGLAEGTILAGECEQSANYHAIPGYSYVEFQNHNPQDMSSKELEIIGTSLYNRVFPFIRYYSGDLAELSLKECECHRGYQIISKLVGRESEFFLASDGSELSVSTLRAFHDDILGGIIDYQFLQKTPGVVEVIIIKDKKYSHEDEVRLISELNYRSRNRLKFVAVYKDQLIKTNSGKAKILIKEFDENPVCQNQKNVDRQ